MNSNILKKRFGQSRLLNFEALEWLESTMHAKTVKFDIGKGGGAPDVTWEDRCAAVAMIKSKPARALASLLVWGYDQDQFDIIAHHLAGKMAAQCRLVLSGINMNDRTYSNQLLGYQRLMIDILAGLGDTIQTDVVAYKKT